MTELFVSPSGPLHGEITVGGSKNAALPILAATLLCEGKCRLRRLPDIRDVHLFLEMLKEMGATVQRCNEDTYDIDTGGATPQEKASPLSGEMRASVYFLGAGLGRFGEGRIGQPGGCDFGSRPIDYHVRAFSLLGAETKEENGEIAVCGKKRKGCEIRFAKTSVGATVNAILASVTATGGTRIVGAAREPHVVELCRFLNRAGARIVGAGTCVICIEGVPNLQGCDFEIAGDMIEAGTYLLAGAVTRGRVGVLGIRGEETPAAA